MTLEMGDDGTIVTAQVELTDKAGNVGTSPAVEFRRDASGPAAPQLSLVTGNGPRRTVEVRTADPDVSSYVVRTCLGDTCSERRQPASGRVDVDLPAPGSYRVEIALIDRAGNVGAAANITADYADTTVVPPKATGLAITTPAKFPKGRKRPTTVLAKGTVKPGAATKITVTVSGRPAGRKRTVSYKKSVKPNPKTGAWSVRLRLPKPVSFKHGVLLAAKATPAPGFAPSELSKRVRG